MSDHIYGLKKAQQDCSSGLGSQLGSEDAVGWLTSDGGCIWVVKKVDELVAMLSAETGRASQAGAKL